MRNKVIQFVKEPLAQFLLIGACIYGAYALFGAPDEDTGERTIVVDAGRIQGFIAAWEQRWNRPPTSRELDALIQQFVREDILYREAVAMGLDKDDPITRRRMAQKIEFLTKDIARLRAPQDGELKEYFESNAELYRKPDLITFSQVFLDPDKRKEQTRQDAAALLTRLQAAGEPEPGTLNAGDRLMLQSYYPAISEFEIRRLFGSGFSEVVMQLAPDQWHGPVRSGYGTHLVYVHALEVALPPLFANVRDRVLENWRTEQQEEFNAQYFESLKSRYEIVIEEVPARPIVERKADARTDGDSGRQAKPES